MNGYCQLCSMAAARMLPYVTIGVAVMHSCYGGYYDISPPYATHDIRDIFCYAGISRRR